MNPEIKAKWIEALRSGEYKQGHGALSWQPQDGAGTKEFCCLGVLCEIAIKEGVIGQPKIYANGGVEYALNTNDPRGDVLPLVVADWAGLPYGDRGGNLRVHVPEEMEKYLGESDWAEEGKHFISALNDGGASFEQIADLIEEQA